MFGESFSLGIQYREDVRRKELELLPARTQKEDHCCRSGFCCWRAPAELTVEDLTKLAKHKEMSESEFFKVYCVVDTFDGDSRNIIRLRRKHQSGGVMTYWRETYRVSSPCIFLKEEGKNNASCEVHGAKPAVCGRYKCWEEEKSGREIASEMGRWTREKLIQLGWNGINPDDYEEE